jgi:threonine/homoserine/homoserine lactone efflux protein
VLHTVTAGLGREARTGPWGAAAVRTHVLTRPRVLTWLRRTFAAAFVALGARLATAEG